MPKHLNENKEHIINNNTQHKQVFGLYMVSENMWVPFMYETTDGQIWVCERHPFNIRGGHCMLKQTYKYSSF